MLSKKGKKRRTLTSHTRDMIITSLLKNGVVEEIADRLGVHRTTVYYYKNKYILGKKYGKYGDYGK